MRIGIDLTWLSDHFSGLERYSASVTRQILDIDKHNEYILFFKDYVFEWFRKYERNQFVKTIIIPRGKSGKAFFSQIQLPLAMKKERLDLALFLAFPCPIFYKGKSVSAIHDLTCFDFPNTMTCKSRMYWRIIDNRAANDDGLIITVSEFSKSRIVDHYGKKPEQIIVTYSGLDRNLFNPTYGLGREKEVQARYHLPQHYILSLSTLEPRKGLDILADAWSQLWNAGFRDRDLVLAGREGWEMNNFLANINAEARSHIHITGFIDDNDLPLLYRMSDLFVFPSRYEGFGAPPIEAHNSGAHVLCSDIPPLKEICGNKVAYFKSEDVNDLKRALSDARLFENIDKTILNYSWDAVARTLLEGIGI